MSTLKSKFLIKQEINGKMSKHMAKRVSDNMFTFKETPYQNVTIQYFDDSVKIIKEGQVNLEIEHKKNDIVVVDVNINMHGKKFQTRSKIRTKDVNVNEDFISIIYQNEEEKIDHKIFIEEKNE